MPTPNLPHGFDFLDPDRNVKKLPVDELAELRKVAPIWWCEQPIGKGGFNDGGYWVVTKHKDVKEVSRRNDIFSSWENGAIPQFADDMSRDDIDLQRFVMLNMDGEHHDRLRRIISKGFTPRAVGMLKDELNDRAQAIAKAGTAIRCCGSRPFRRLRRAGGVRAPSAGDRRFAGCAAGGSREAVPLVQRDDRR